MPGDSQPETRRIREKRQPSPSLESPATGLTGQGERYRLKYSAPTCHHHPREERLEWLSTALGSSPARPDASRKNAKYGAPLESPATGLTGQDDRPATTIKQPTVLPYLRMGGPHGQVARPGTRKTSLEASAKNANRVPPLESPSDWLIGPRRVDWLTKTAQNC